jgi:hypothetical protein
MATRIKYVKTDAYIHTTLYNYIRNGKNIKASFNTQEMIAIITVNSAQEFVSYKIGPYKTVAQLKKEIKLAIEKEGFRFESEVRNKRRHKKAIDKALDGENNE